MRSERDIRIHLFCVSKHLTNYDIDRNFCQDGCSVFGFFDFFVEVDWDVHSLVTPGNLLSNLPRQGHSFVGRGKVWTDHEVQSPRGSADRLLSLWAIHGDLQPHPVHPGRPAADYYLGHQDRHEEARLPLRDTIHLAHTQVSINNVFCSLVMNLINFAWHSWTLNRIENE